MKGQKKLLVLGAGILQIPIIQKAKELGYFVIAADGSEVAPGLPLADKGIVADIVSEDKMLGIARNEHIDGVIHPCSEVAMNVMGYINENMSLSGIDRNTAIRATNKHLMREAFENHGVSSPKSILLSSAEQGWDIFRNLLNSDAILKPSRNSGSRGIERVDKNITEEQFSEYYNRSLSASRDHSVLIEQFVDGPEFSVEIIIWNNKANVLTVTDKKTTGVPYFVELGHNQPSIYSNEIVTSLKEEALKGVTALGLNNCAAHAELKIQNGVPYIMEIGARLGGDFICTDLVRLSTGVDMVAAAINVALGISPDLSPKTPKTAVAIRYFTPKPGKLVSIDNIEVLKEPYIYNYQIYCKSGDTINCLRSSTDRSGHVIVTADTPQIAISRAENIIDTVRFNIEHGE